MNDERFFDLAMKVIARQCTDAERAELDALVAGQPELKAEFERLRAEVGVAKEALPLVNATEATAGELPAYARGRLQTKVRQTLGRQETERGTERSPAWGWRWALGVAAATAVIVLLVLPTFRTSSEPVVQVAMLDAGGATRGSDTNVGSAFRQKWEKATVDLLPTAEALRVWETNWPASKRPAFKIIYDRAAGEVRVLGRWKGKPIEKTFLIEQDLPAALQQAKDFIQIETTR
jgi:hypothetical protein